MAKALFVLVATMPPEKLFSALSRGMLAGSWESETGPA